MITHLDIPYRFTNRSRGMVEEAMLDLQLDKPSALGFDYSVPPMRELDQNLYANYDTSFTRQLGEVAFRPKCDIPPSVIAFTESSAIPVADAVRSFYGYLDLKQPTLITVNPEIDRSQTKYLDHLRYLVNDAHHACVVEEIVFSGQTIRKARQMLLSAGARHVSMVQGHWYHGARITSGQRHLITSRHRSFMNRIGVQAAAASK